jgi:RHS repeat-associated protein
LIPIKEESNYYPYGLTMAGISDKALKGGYAENKHKFVGQLYDDDLGWDMYQFRFRDHDPQIGRFWQVDPLATKYPHNSTYAYAEDRPINGIDLEGLEWWLSPLLGLAENNSVITRGPVIENVVKTTAEAGNKVAEASTEDHHVIPRQLKNDGTVESAREGGFKFEGKENLAENLSKFSKKSGEGQHGPHPEYTKEIAKQLAEFRKDNPNATSEEATQFVRNLVKETKETIANNPGKKINDLFKDVKIPVASDATKNVIFIPSIVPNSKETKATFVPQQIIM